MNTFAKTEKEFEGNLATVLLCAYFEQILTYPEQIELNPSFILVLDKERWSQAPRGCKVVITDTCGFYGDKKKRSQQRIYLH
ncbi:hypothetical protein L323_13130 [Ruminiclostridium papyrosolvens C7]|uniref:Uncharacterized protein n=1 Tax=Ruminiclostridium papyrosolvens C7 TaxID=1330534 RepID=U4R177_9FIRM|nr:hypothetical protein L323_13130 [Ruminiclostridium papyrosolvens C7]